MLKGTLKRNKGITLITLVVTIIVLLILAGISLGMLTGENGILNRAAEAKEKTGAANKEERRKLAQAEALMNTESTTYNGVSVPVGFAPTKIEGEDSVDEGLVITDGYGNEYVWVEVPTAIYSDSKYNTNGTPSSVEDWEKIRDCLKAYTSDYSDSDCKDTNTDGTTYSNDYKNMLKSVYTNGGFWIGRYEAGLEEGKSPRTSYVAIAESDKAVTKPNMYPYNYVRRDEAQTLAERMNYDGVTSSLIYGVQWDLVLKFIETKGGATLADLKIDSSNIGNYCNTQKTLISGKYASISNLAQWNDYNIDLENCVQNGKTMARVPVLITTGASDETKICNIFDIAGNVFEWTREFYDTSNPCVDRGGSYSNGGSSGPAKVRNLSSTSFSNNYIGFRLGLWK